MVFLFQHRLGNKTKHTPPHPFVFYFPQPAQPYPTPADRGAGDWRRAGGVGIVDIHGYLMLSMARFDASLASLWLSLGSLWGNCCVTLESDLINLGSLVGKFGVRLLACCDQSGINPHDSESFRDQVFVLFQHRE